MSRANTVSDVVEVCLPEVAAKVQDTERLSSGNILITASVVPHIDIFRIARAVPAREGGELVTKSSGRETRRATKVEVKCMIVVSVSRIALC